MIHIESKYDKGWITAEDAAKNTHEIKTAVFEKERSLPEHKK